MTLSEISDTEKYLAVSYWWTSQHCNLETWLKIWSPFLLNHLTKIILGTQILFALHHISKFACNLFRKLIQTWLTLLFQTYSFKTINIKLQFLFFCIFFWGTSNLDLAPIMFPLSFKYIKLCILYFDRTFQLWELKMLTWSTLTPKMTFVSQ